MSAASLAMAWGVGSDAKAGRVYIDRGPGPVRPQISIDGSPLAGGLKRTVSRSELFGPRPIKVTNVLGKTIFQGRINVPVKGELYLAFKDGQLVETARLVGNGQLVMETSEGDRPGTHPGAIHGARPIGQIPNDAWVIPLGEGLPKVPIRLPSGRELLATVDTGASDLTVCPQLRDELGFSFRASGQVEDANGRRVNTLFGLSSYIKLLGNAVQKVETSVVFGLPCNEPLLGMGPMSAFELAIEPEAIYAWVQEPPALQVPNLRFDIDKTLTVAADVRWPGTGSQEEVYLTLDSGAELSFITRAKVRALGAQATETIQIVTVSGEQQVDVVQLDLDIAGRRIPAVSFMVVDQALDTDGGLGLNGLAHLQVRINHLGADLRPK